MPRRAPPCRQKGRRGMPPKWHETPRRILCPPMPPTGHGKAAETPRRALILCPPSCPHFAAPRHPQNAARNVPRNVAENAARNVAADGAKFAARRALILAADAHGTPTGHRMPAARSGRPRIYIMSETPPQAARAPSFCAPCRRTRRPVA